MLMLLNLLGGIPYSALADQDILKQTRERHVFSLVTVVSKSCARCSPLLLTCLPLAKSFLAERGLPGYDMHTLCGLVQCWHRHLPTQVVEWCVPTPPSPQCARTWGSTNNAFPVMTHTFVFSPVCHSKMLTGHTNIYLLPACHALPQSHWLSVSSPIRYLMNMLPVVVPFAFPGSFLAGFTEEKKESQG
jgi:hypothetical protein